MRQFTLSFFILLLFGLFSLTASDCNNPNPDLSHCYEDVDSPRVCSSENTAPMRTFDEQKWNCQNANAKRNEFCELLYLSDLERSEGLQCGQVMTCRQEAINCSAYRDTLCNPTTAIGTLLCYNSSSKRDVCLEKRLNQRFVAAGTTLKAVIENLDKEFPIPLRHAVQWFDTDYNKRRESAAIPQVFKEWPWMFEVAVDLTYQGNIWQREAFHWTEFKKESHALMQVVNVLSVQSAYCLNDKNRFTERCVDRTRCIIKAAKDILSHKCEKVSTTTTKPPNQQEYWQCKANTERWTSYALTGSHQIRTAKGVPSLEPTINPKSDYRNILAVPTKPLSHSSSEIISQCPYPINSASTFCWKKGPSVKSLIRNNQQIPCLTLIANFNWKDGEHTGDKHSGYVGFFQGYDNIYKELWIYQQRANRWAATYNIPFDLDSDIDLDYYIVQLEDKPICVQPKKPLSKTELVLYEKFAKVVKGALLKKDSKDSLYWDGGVDELRLMVNAISNREEKAKFQKIRGFKKDPDHPYDLSIYPEVKNQMATVDLTQDELNLDLLNAFNQRTTSIGYEDLVYWIKIGTDVPPELTKKAKYTLTRSGTVYNYYSINILNPTAQSASNQLPTSRSSDSLTCSLSSCKCSSGALQQGTMGTFSGCSVSSSVLTTWNEPFPNLPQFLVSEWTENCNNLEKCYHTCGKEKSDCDKQLGDNTKKRCATDVQQFFNLHSMLSQCSTVCELENSGYFTSFGIPDSSSPICEPRTSSNCQNSKFGSEHFVKAAIQQCERIATDIPKKMPTTSNPDFRNAQQNSCSCTS